MRIIVSVLLGLVVMTNVTIPDVASFPDLTIFGVVVAELFIGLAAGLILTIMFSAALLAGEKLLVPPALVWQRKWILTRAVKHRLSAKPCHCS